MGISIHSFAVAAVLALVWTSAVLSSPLLPSQGLTKRGTISDIEEMLSKAIPLPTTPKEAATTLLTLEKGLREIEKKQTLEELDLQRYEEWHQRYLDYLTKVDVFDDIVIPQWSQKVTELVPDLIRPDNINWRRNRILRAHETLHRLPIFRSCRDSDCVNLLRIVLCDWKALTRDISPGNPLILGTASPKTLSMARKHFPVYFTPRRDLQDCPSDTAFADDWDKAKENDTQGKVQDEPNDTRGKGRGGPNVQKDPEQPGKEGWLDWLKSTSIARWLKNILVRFGFLSAKPHNE